MICLSCSRENGDSNFCSGCGAALKGRKSKLFRLYKRAKWKATEYHDQARIKLSSNLEKYIHRIQNHGITFGGRSLSSEKSESVANYLSNLKSRITPDDFDNLDDYNQWISSLDERIGSDKCIICFQSWKTIDKITVCNKCYQGGHLEHMKVWIQSNKSCPLCLEPLKTKDLLLVEIKGY